MTFGGLGNFSNVKFKNMSVSCMFQKTAFFIMKQSLILTIAFIITIIIIAITAIINNDRARVLGVVL